MVNDDSLWFVLIVYLLNTHLDTIIEHMFKSASGIYRLSALKIHCNDLCLKTVCYLHDVFSDSADPNHCMVNISIYTWTARTAHDGVSPRVCRVDSALQGTVVPAAVMQVVPVKEISMLHVETTASYVAIHVYAVVNILPLQ